MDDLISRDFIKSLGGECIAARDSKTHELLPISSIDALPSAQPQRKKGKWKRNITAERDAQLIFTKVYNCSECGYESVGNNLKNFCPNCGCDMRGDEE